jgi:hypothetical protein
MLVEEISWGQFKEDLIELEWKEYQEITKNEDQKDNFFRLRRSQFALWSDKMLESRFWDLERAKDSGHNLLADKYTWVLKYTDPEDFEKTKLNLAVEDMDQETLINIITTIETEWENMFEKEYPNLSRFSSRLHSYEDKKENLPFNACLWGELHTFSKNTLDAYWDMVDYFAETGKNMISAIMYAMVKEYGYRSLEEAEKAAPRNFAIYH